jgi:hypothetical protein
MLMPNSGKMQANGPPAKKACNQAAAQVGVIS